ncbi:DUF927 domain-containing protein [Streptomyces sp. NPDC017941]|uniref:DUF927 domain-containing protein n=1 Tax=Streptomyces sp. NPDC017941 TaxID=3365018 RepID=UPI003787AED5
MAQQPQASDTDVPSQRKTKSKPPSPGTQPIAGMRAGWLYRAADRMVLHQRSPEGPALPIGQVPKVIATVTHLTDDGEDIRTEYLAMGKRQRRGRILTEDELDRGTWASKMGMRRPTGSDEKHAFARLIREEGDRAPIISARTYYNDDGDLIFPDADAQTLGYRVLRGVEKDAREAWDEIGAWTCDCGKSALVLGAMFAGPVLDSLDVLAHMVNCYGPAQQGKSTVQMLCAALLGDIKPRRQQIMIPWNSSKQGITQTLRLRGLLSICLEEHSSSGRKIQESSREISQMVAGAIRAMGTADGSPRESDGFWCSCAVSSSNEPLKHEGQTEDLASRLQEFQAPFFPDRMLLPDGSPAPAGHPGAEHVSKRLKRLAKDFGGWPLEWAINKGMFRAKNLAQIKKLHLELCSKYRPAQGGLSATIAELHMAWVVGAYMLGEAIGVPEIGTAAEKEAAARLQDAIVVAAETNTPDHEKLWSALDALRIEKSAFPDVDKLPSAAEDGFRRLRGFLTPESGEWWVINPVVQEAALAAGIDNVGAALRELDSLGVHIRGTGKHAQRLLPRAVRDYGLGARMHCFDTRRAADLFALDETPQPHPGGEFPSGTTPRNHPGTTGVVPENTALTSTGTTGTTGTTLSLFDFSNQDGTTPPTPPADESTDSRTHDVTTAVPPMPTKPPAVPYPAPVEAVTDPKFAALAAKAEGRTRSGIAFGVLGDGQLYLPNREPVTVAMPGTVDDVPALMQAYALKTLWVHESGATAMGLPSCEERRQLPVVGKDQEDHDGRPGLLGPQAPVSHPWSTPSGAGPVTEVAPGGLASWLTLICGQGPDVTRLSVALPLYETRFDTEHGRGGFGGPTTPEELLDALMVWTLSTVHGPADRPRVTPYYSSVNRTAEDLAGGRGRTDVICEAVRRREVEPVLSNRVPLMVPQNWHRPPTSAEIGMAAVHRFDKSAAWLGAFSNVRLGIGEPLHVTSGATYQGDAVPGFWRVSQIPGHGPEGLPQLRFREADAGGYWISTPSMPLLCELYPGWEPDVVEAWFWPEHKRALEGMYKRIAASRKLIVAAIEAGRPGAKWAKTINGRSYQSFRGYMARTSGPMVDHATGGDYRQDIYYRPDWARLIMDLGTANLYRNLKSFSEAGHLPLAVHVDAVTYASHESDPEQAKPALMQLGSAGGQWTIEGSAPLSALLPALEAGTSAHKALDAYLTTGE